MSNEYVPTLVFGGPVVVNKKVWHVVYTRPATFQEVQVEIDAMLEGIIDDMEGLSEDLLA